MQKLKYISLLSIILIIACKPSNVSNKTILTAENLLYTNPDSSYKLLKSIKSPRQLPDADYAAWCLNYVHARYKLYIEANTDTVLLNNALQYFQKNGPKKYLGISYFLKGCFEIDKKNEKTAVYNFKQAENLLKNTTEYLIYGLTLHRISHIYLNSGLYTGSYGYIKKAITSFKKTNNTYYIYYGYNTLTEILITLKADFPEIIKSANICLQYAYKNKDTNIISDALFLNGHIYIDHNNTVAIKYLLQAYNLPTKRKNRILPLIALTFNKLNKVDSAKYYIKKYDVDTADIKSFYLYKLINAYISREDKRLNFAFSELEESWNLREKEINEVNKNLIIKIDKQYDYSQKEQERAKLEIANQQKIILIILLFVLILIGIFVQLQIRNRHKLKQNSMALEQKLLQFEIESQKRQHIQSLSLIQANINNKIENTVKYKKLNTGLTNKDKIDDFIADVAKQAVVSENELDFYMQEADNLFGNRISKLKLHFPQLTTSDLIVISLICLRVDFNSICILLNISLNTLYTRRKRIKAHMGFDKNIDLETWIEQNIIKPE